jgi:NAD(P)-dependent dehydrogenase (short-subunit alcohol dehydrogenase family)
MADKIDFSGRVAIVTGAGGGLGSEYCRALAARGAAVVLNDLGGNTDGEGASTGYADRVAAEIKSMGGKAVANYDTVSTPEGGEAIVRSALDHFGHIDIVMNNAGNQRNVRFGELSEADIDSVFDVHVKGTFFVTQPAYHLMVRQGYGRIVLVSSQSGIFGNPIRSNYASAKTAMIGPMNVIAQEAPPGVAINCLFPNAVGGRLGGQPGDIRSDAEFLAAAGKRVPNYIDGMQPCFVAPLACYLASERCTHSQHMYSVLGGKYSRIFTGLTAGWYHAGKVLPTIEEVVAHLPQIDDLGRYDVPLSGLDEMDTVIALQRRLQG